MMWLFRLLSLAFICYALFRAPRRPGLFGGVAINSYLYSVYLGSAGPILGFLALAIAAAELYARREAILLPSEKMLGLWVIAIATSTLFSLYLDDALMDVAFLVTLCIPAYVYARTFARDERFLLDLVVASCVTLLLCEPGMLLTTPANSWARVTGSLSAVGASTGADIAMAGSISLLMFHQRLTTRQKMGVAAFLVFILAPISFLMGTRGVFLGAGAAFVVLALMKLAHGQWRALINGLLAFAIAGAGLLGLLLALVPFLPNPTMARAILRTVGFLLGHSNVVAIDASSLVRIKYYGAAWDLFLASPLFGHGVGAFAYLANNAAGLYPHNMFLQVLVDLGLAGLIMLLGWLLPVIWQAVRQALREPRWAEMFALALFIDTFTRMQVSISLMQAKYMFLAGGIIVSQYLAARMSVRTDERRRYPPPPVPASAR